MAAIIQEGKMSAPSQGGLFQGKSFWLSRKVPGRNNFIQQINANGGEVVDREKDADICLIDHLKDGADEGMFSYKYIEKSLRNRKLEDLENHRVLLPKKKTVRPKGLRGRNFFTQEDDEILLDVLSKTTLALSGNKVYEQLAAEYPNHTMHSWRGRWIDHYSPMMPHGPVPIRKKNQQKEGYEGEPAEQKSEERVRVKREGEQFTEEDETILRKMAAQLLDDPSDMVNYERLSKRQPQHTPRQWYIIFTQAVLPKIAREKMTERSSLQLKRKIPKPKDNRSDSEEEPAASSSRDRRLSRAKQEIKVKPELTSSPSDLKHRKPQPPTNTNSPIRTMSIRDPPRSISKERGRPSVPRQPHRSTTDSPYRTTSPTPEVSLKAVNKKMAPGPQKSPQQRRRAGIQRTPTVEDQDSEHTPTSSPPKTKPNLTSNNQKRKHDNSGFTPEQRKKKKNTYEAVESTPEPESSTQSRILSPELEGNETQSSPLVAKDKNNKQGYAEMSTQALYDQVDDKGSFAEDMEFPEIPSTPPSPTPRTVSPRPPPEAKSKPKLTPPSKLSVQPSAPGSKYKLSPSTRDDPDGIERINTFLVHCREKYKASEKKVIYAIERTSGVTALVEMVLQNIIDGKPLPVDVPGIWSEEEDKILMGADSREMRKLADEKGDGHIQRRMEFLNLWNMA